MDDANQHIEALARRNLLKEADMHTPASIAKHPIHPMLIVFPIGLWVFSLVCDIVFRITDRTLWNDIAFYTMAGGLVLWSQWTSPSSSATVI